MGYFDALASGAFKTTPDGRKLFFPWGVYGRGYLIGSEFDYQRLRGQIKTFIIIAIMLMFGTFVLPRYLPSIVVGAALIAFYYAWARYLLRGLQPSDQRLSLRESFIAQAQAQNPAILWMAEIVSITLAGVLILGFEPDQWLVDTATIIFFGILAALFMVMLVLRRRT